MRFGRGCSVAHDVFISYTSSDKAAADAVCHRLEGAGIRCWIAPRDVGFGKDWGASIVEAIGEAKLVVVIFSAAANASRHVLDEVGTALDAGATVIPFRIENILPTGALRLHLTRLHWLDALSSPLDGHIDLLIQSAKRNLPGASADNGARPRQEEGPAPSEEPQRERDEQQSHRREEAVPRMKKANAASSVDAKKSPRPQGFALVAVAIAIIAAGGFLWRSGIMDAGKTPVVTREEPKSPNPLPAPVHEPAWTAWMDQEAYQQEFDRQVKNRWYPSMIEAALQSGIIMYRAVYKPYPSTTFEFYSRHSIRDDEFREFDAKMSSAGFTRVFQQRIIGPTQAFNQATWTRQ
jgi:hypothetical protein